MWDSGCSRLKFRPRPRRIGHSAGRWALEVVQMASARKRERSDICKKNLGDGHSRPFVPSLAAEEGQ